MTTWDQQTDVLIVGSGVAGLSAAIEARRAGAEVVVLEKMKVAGGNTRISDGGLAAPGISLQKEKGIQDSPELFYDDLLKAGLGLNHPRLVRTFVNNAAEAIEWTEIELGLRYQARLDRFGGHSVARCLTTINHTGADIIKVQRAKLQAMGGEIRTGCRLEHLVADDWGAVRGLQIRSGYVFGDENSGTRECYGARRAVVLATGGFGNDVGFRTLHNPRLTENLGTTNQRGATAEGLIAAMEIKAAAVHLSRIQLGPWGCADESGYGRGASFASYAVYPGGILVDPASGQRIVDEWSDRRRRCDAIFTAGHVCVGIVDARGAEVAADSLEPCLKRGTVRAFQNLTELGAAYEMPPGGLEDTVEDYNAMIHRGVADRFGKSLHQGARPVCEPPFFALRLWPKVHYTPGGLAIDPQARVIDLQGQPIRRLFAAGEVCGGIHGASRLGSCALTECIVFGRIAGQQAAALGPNVATG